MSAKASKLKFFKTFLTSPMQIGAVLPSSPALAREITAPIDYDRAKVIVEFGPGTGAFTEVLLQRKKPETRLIALEINDVMAEEMARAHPDVDLVHDGAQNLLEHLARRGIKEVDAIVCGLPFAQFPPRLQEEILDGVVRSLRPGGIFLSFTYYHSNALPTTHRYRARLKKLFKSVKRIPVLRNVPPAYVSRCEA